MKKLMIAAAIVCAAAFAQAATYNWSADGMAYWDDDSSNYDEFDGFKVYAFDASVVTYGAVIDALTNDGADILGQALSPAGAVSDGYMYMFSGSGINATGDGDGAINAFLVMVGTGADGKDYFASAVIDPIEVTTPVKEGGAKLSYDFAMAELPGAGAAGWTQVADVPEPTSGLLLLLGVAGLALRRRA